MKTKEKTERICPNCGKKFWSRQFNFCSRYCILKHTKPDFGYNVKPKITPFSLPIKKLKFTWKRYLKQHPELINDKLFATPQSFYTWAGQKYKDASFELPVKQIIQRRKEQCKKQERVPCANTPSIRKTPFK